MISSGKKSTRGPKWTVEIGFVLVVALVIIGLKIEQHPITLPAKDQPTGEALAASGTSGADVLLVISSSGVAASTTQWNLDQAWLNTIEQEIGEYQVRTVQELTRSDLDTTSWVIIPRRASAEFDATQIQAVANWVEDGGVAIIEQPEGPWQQLTGAILSRARLRETRRITSFDASPARGRTREKVVSMPLRTTLIPYTPRELSRGRDYQVLLEIDGSPGVVSLQRGRGKLFVVMFDFARAVTSTQQGSPTDNFETPRSADSPLPAKLSTTQSLSRDEDYFETTVPWTDLLERNLLYLADRQRPVPRLWNYPGDHRGAFLVTHSEAGAGIRSEFMIDWEHRSNEPSTLFTVAESIAPQGLARLSRKGASVSLQWVPSNAPIVPYETWGLRNFRPIRRAMGIQEQLEALNEALQPYGPTRSGRSLDGIWLRDYFRPFELLEASDIELDSSFGPAPRVLAEGEPRVGYLFGTGLPYRPLGVRGDRFSFFELPFQFTDANEAYSIRKVRELIIGASDLYHTTVVGDWRPDTMIRRPSYDALEGWRSAYQLAHSQRLWVTTAAEYVKFLRYRDEAAIRSTFSERRLSIEVIVPEVERNEDGQYLDLVPSVAVPARFRGRPVEHLWRDGVPVDVNELVMTGDRALYLIPLVPGEHRIEVYYGQAPAFSE